MGVQVLDDYTSATGRRVEELTEQQRHATSAYQSLRLKSMLDRELAKLDSARLDQTLNEVGLGNRSRKSNRDWCNKLDNAIKQATGFGLDNFRPARRAAPLQSDQTRVFIDHPGPDGALQRRSVIESADGSRVLEVPRLLYGGKNGDQRNETYPFQIMARSCSVPGTSGLQDPFGPSGPVRAWTARNKQNNGA